MRPRRLRRREGRGWSTEALEPGARPNLVERAAGGLLDRYLEARRGHETERGELVYSAKDAVKVRIAGPAGSTTVSIDVPRLDLTSWGTGSAAEYSGMGVQLLLRGTMRLVRRGPGKDEGLSTGVGCEESDRRSPLQVRSFLVPVLCGPSLRTAHPHMRSPERRGEREREQAGLHGKVAFRLGRRETSHRWSARCTDSEGSGRQVRWPSSPGNSP